MLMPEINQIAGISYKIEMLRRAAIMPSAHYETISAMLQENMKLLSDSSGEVRLDSKAIWNLGCALLALSDAIADEFVCINTRLTYIEQHLNHSLQ
jgi:hypothetical protein